MPQTLRNEARVLSAVEKELVNKIIVDNTTDLVDYSYFLTLDKQNIDSQTNKPAGRTRVLMRMTTESGKVVSGKEQFYKIREH